MLLNILAYNHAYRFTHFTAKTNERPKPAAEYTQDEKINALLYGVEIAKPYLYSMPVADHEIIKLKGEEQLEAWWIEAFIPGPTSGIADIEERGVVILFHGYMNSKSSLLNTARVFRAKGFDTFLVDFRGSGGSVGYETTIGYKESKDVKIAYDYITKRHPNREVVLFGISMGAVAIMKAVAEGDVDPDKIILECPFGSFLETVQNRFAQVGVPAFPLAELLLIHGGFQLGFNPFEHKPTEYAKKINIPTLVLYGAKDENVSRSETEKIFQNLAGEKDLHIFPEEGHHIKIDEDWNWIVNGFLKVEPNF